MPDKPNPITNPAILEDMTAELTRRFEHIELSYRSSKQVLSGPLDFNTSLRRLRAAVECSAPANERGSPLNLQIQLFISHTARKFADERAGQADAEVLQIDIDRAAIHAAGTLKIRRGARNDPLLRYHIEGAMALVQEYVGKPVIVQRYRSLGGGEVKYDPHFIEGVSRSVPIVFKRIAPRVRESTLVRMVEDARRKFAGKPMRFIDFFPMYGAAIDAEGQPQPRAPYRLEHWEPIIPIYCR